MKKNGFTLIELLMVVAIMGVLAAVALPGYQIYTIRPKSAELIGFGENCRLKVTEYFSSHGSFPASDSDDAGCSTASPIGTYTQSVAVLKDGSGIVRVTALESSYGVSGYIDMVPTTDAGALQWTCAQGTVASRFLPEACRNPG